MGKNTKGRRTRESPSARGSRSQKLRDLLDRGQPEVSSLQKELESLERSDGPEVYRDWLYLLGGLQVDPTSAKDYWTGVLGRWSDLETKQGSSIDPRVALVSYVIDTQRAQDQSTDFEIHLGQARRDASDWDELTGLANSRSFSESLERELRTGERSNRPVSLLMIDVDDFEQYNDRNGRETGDRALASIGRILSESLRLNDGKIRFSGKEFAVVLPATPKLGAGQVAERLRQNVELQYFPGEDHQPGGKLTIRAGVAAYPGDARNAAELLRQAQRAESAAKAAGRNQIHLIGEDRRSHRRFEVALGGTFSSWATGEFPLTTLNVSRVGLRFSSPENLPPLALVDICMKLPGSEPDVTMAVRIVESEMTRAPSVGWIAGSEVSVGGRYEMSAQIVEISTESLRILTGYLRSLETSGSPDG